ncbi:MAG: ATP synthase F1 subunit gamma [Culicoidibacterales bacterium]
MGSHAALIKSKIASIQKTAQITRSMQMVSQARIAGFEYKMHASEHYANVSEAIFQSLVANASRIDSEVLQIFKPNYEKKTATYIMVSSDRGLAGPYNSAVIKKTTQIINDRHKSPDEYKLYVLGRIGYDAMRRQGFKIENDYINVHDNFKISDLEEVLNGAFETYLNCEVGRVEVIYHRFKNRVVQDVHQLMLLPITGEVLRDEEQERLHPTYIFDEEPDRLVTRMVPLYLNGEMQTILLNTKLCEHTMRVNAMRNATDNAQEIVEKLSLIYNAYRQTAITQELTEIVAGSKAQKGGAKKNGKRKN